VGENLKECGHLKKLDGQLVLVKWILQCNTAGWRSLHSSGAGRSGKLRAGERTGTELGVSQSAVRFSDLK
jgi:hypothetical protein